MSERRINIFELLQNEGKLSKVLLFPAKMTQVDPYEKNSELTYQQSIPIDALVRDVTIEALVWKYFSNLPMGSKQIICEKKWLNSIKASHRIKIDDNYYFTYRDDSKNFGIIVRADYIIVIAELKPINY